MALVGMAAASRYGYSNARVKAMESKLVGNEFVKEISKINEIDTIIAKLLQTDYKRYIEEFGGKEIKSELIDFALRKSFNESTEKLIKVTPNDQKDTIMRIVSKWDVYNIKLALYAKANGKTYDDISKYIISTHLVSTQIMKEAMSEANVDYMVGKLVLSTPYRLVLDAALDTYRKTNGNMTEVSAAIDKAFFDDLGNTIFRLARSSHEAAIVVKLDIEMRNIRVLIRSKRHGSSAARIKDLLIPNGITPSDQLIKIYENARDVKELIENIKSFDLKNVYAQYEASPDRRILLFEIGMRNIIFERMIALLRHSVLSLGTIIAFFYLKEMEIFTLRVVIQGKAYGLSSEEINSMIKWQI